MKPEVEGQPLTWQVLEIISASENVKHDEAAVHGTACEKLLRIVHLMPAFYDKTRKDKKIDYDGLLAMLVSHSLPTTRVVGIFLPTLLF